MCPWRSDPILYSYLIINLQNTPMRTHRTMNTHTHTLPTPLPSTSSHLTNMTDKDTCFILKVTIHSHILWDLSKSRFLLLKIEQCVLIRLQTSPKSRANPVLLKVPLLPLKRGMSDSIKFKLILTGTLENHTCSWVSQ